MKWIFAAISILTLIFFASTLPNIKWQESRGENKNAPQAGAADYTKITFGRLIEGAKNQESALTLRDEAKDQITFLFLGVGGEEHISGNYLTDTIMLLTLIPSKKRVGAISIPRDLMVRSPDRSYFTRINALYAIPASNPSADPDAHGKNNSEFPGPMGVKYVKETVKNITGVKAEYYAVLDLAGVEKIVDILGGINVRRFEDLEDRAFPDDDYGYETYEIREGWRYLNGEEAAKYIRTRHTPGGDFDRMKRQQEVALAIKKKIEGLQSLSGLPKLFSLYKALQNHFTTNLTFEEIMRLMNIASGIKGEEVKFERITAEEGGLLVPDTMIWGGKKAYILKPRAGTENYEEIREKIAKTIESLKSENE